MSRRLSRISLVFVILLSSEVWALGLGDIRLESALNEPLRAEIELLSATPGELDNLKIMLASAETFDRYGLDRPVYLQGMQFQIIRSGRTDGNVVQVRSQAPMAEPFLTFLVEANWSRGRLLREYTVLLDPPTFAPPAAETAPIVQAPSRSTPADSGRIERPEPAVQQRPMPAPTRQVAPADPEPQLFEPAEPETEPESKPQPVADDTPYDESTSGDYSVVRSETLWGIATRVRPDSRLSMNQTMLAIFEANPEAFGGNINVLKAGASLRIPSADEIFQISRGDALAEAKRHHAAWRGGTVAPVAETRPSLTLVPPDDDFVDDLLGGDDPFADEPQTREEEIEQRITELEGADVPQQQSLIEIRNNELATLREELARIRGEVYEPPVDDTAVDIVDDELTADDPFADDEILPDDTIEDAAVDDAVVEDAQAADDEVADVTPPADIIRAPTRSEPSIVDKIIAAITSKWAAIIAGALVLVGGALFWFMRRGGGDDDAESWQPLDRDEPGSDVTSETATLRAPERIEESIMVVEQESTLQPEMDETVDAPAPEFEQAAPKEDTGAFGSLEDTFSSETAINLDQSDPMAEADFHMAYGLYDQAADLINGALSVEPERADLLTKLCEIYFVWGNRDAFVDAAGRLKAVVGSDESADWDKIVIMGQQIAADDELFAGASAVGATKAVDLAFEAGSEEGGELDMEFIADDDASSADVFDIGADEATVAADADEEIDIFGVGEDIDAELTPFESADTSVSAVLESPDFDMTAALPEVDVTAEMPTPDETAEINLDDLGLDVDSSAEIELASLDDLDATSESVALSDTGINEALEDLSEVTGKNPEVDSSATGLQSVLGDVDETLLDATGATQILSEDFAVDTRTDAGQELSDDDATMLSPGSEDETVEGPIEDEETILASLDDEPAGDFDFAKTEALPKDAFTTNLNMDDTGELPAVASTDVNLDLDDLTAALKVSEMGDTIEQLRDDATVEQPRPVIPQDADETSETMSLTPGDMSDDLHDARTMTEVGTKLDLARAYVDMGDPNGARSILEEVLDEGDEGQRQQAQQLLDSLPG